MLDVEMLKDLQHNIYALKVCYIDNEEGEYVAGTPEQAFQYMSNGKVSNKINNDDKIDIYIMLNEFDKEFRVTESEVLEYYNISKSCLYDAKRWVRKNKPDIVKKYDNQINLIDDIKVDLSVKNVVKTEKQIIKKVKDKCEDIKELFANQSNMFDLLQIS